MGQTLAGESSQCLGSVMGLGLYTARYALRRMGGDIALISSNHATTFSLKLPKRFNHRYQEFLKVVADSNV